MAEDGWAEYRAARDEPPPERPPRAIPTSAFVIVGLWVLGVVWVLFGECPEVTGGGANIGCGILAAFVLLPVLVITGFWGVAILLISWARKGDR